MKRSIFTLALCSMLFAPCYALAQSITINLGTGSQTITPTANQVTKIARLRDLENARRATETPPLSAITSEQWLQGILVGVVQDYVREADRQNAVDACATYKAASGATKTGIDSALGNRSPCP